MATKPRTSTKPATKAETPVQTITLEDLADEGALAVILNENDIVGGPKHRLAVEMDIRRYLFAKEMKPRHMAQWFIWASHAGTAAKEEGDQYLTNFGDRGDFGKCADAGLLDDISKEPAPKRKNSGFKPKL